MEEGKTYWAHLVLLVAMVVALVLWICGAVIHDICTLVVVEVISWAIGVLAVVGSYYRMYGGLGLRWGFADGPFWPLSLLAETLDRLGFEGVSGPEQEE